MKMRKKLTFLLIILALGTMTVSCKKKAKDNKTSQTQISNKPINTDIFNLGAKQGQGNPNIQNLTPEEQQKLIDNQIDPAKVSEALTKAQNGDKESIMTLAQLYYNLKDTNKVKQILQYGVDKGYPEAIYNLAVILKQEGNTEQANKLMAQLPRTTERVVRRQGGGRVVSGGNGGGPVMIRQLRMRPGAEEYNKAVDLVRAKKYDEAKKYFEKAYDAGIKEADVRIALINKEQKNTAESVKWFQKAANRGVKEANFEVGAMLYDSGKQEEARPYLMKAYKAGNKSLAMPIAMSYHNQKDTAEAVKWYKIAAQNGDKNAKATLERIERPNPSGESHSVTKSESGKSGSSSTFLGNSDSKSLTESTLNSVKSKGKAEEEKKIEEKKDTNENHNNEKKEVNIDEIMKNKVKEYSK